MAFNVANLVAKLSANTVQFQREMSRAESKLRTFARTAGRLTVAAAAAAATASGALAGRAINAADQVDKLSTRLGVSAERLSTLRLVADRSGLSFEALTTGLQRLQRRTQEAADGNAQLQKTFAQINIDFRKFAELDVVAKLELLADAMVRLPNASERLARAFKLLDTEGVALLQAMTEGAAGVRDMRQASIDLGSALDEKTRAQAVAVKDALANLSAAGIGAGNVFLRVFGPTIEAVSNFIASNLVPSINLAGKALIGLRVLAVSGAAIVAAIFRQDDLFRRLAELASSYVDEFSKGAAAAGRFNVELGKQAKLEDFMLSVEQRRALLEEKSRSRQFGRQVRLSETFIASATPKRRTETQQIESEQLEQTNRLLGFIVRNTAGGDQALVKVF